MHLEAGYLIFKSKIQILMNNLLSRVIPYNNLPNSDQERHLNFMREALVEANNAGNDLEVPIGCVIVNDQGDIIGRGQNRTIRKHEVLAHAEVEALRDASQKSGDFRLDDCSCYVTLEPCLMCLGALLHARITSVHFGIAEPKFGAVFSRFNLIDHERFAKFSCYSGYLADEITCMMADFFKNLRRKS